MPAGLLDLRALVLWFTDVGEADRIVSFLTREQGVVRAGVSGARGLSRGRAAAFDLFALVDLTLHLSSKPGKLPRVRGVSVVDPHLGMRDDYQRLCAASYIAESVSRSVPEGEPAEAVTDLVLHCLSRLSAGEPEYPLLLLFEARFLREMGWLPELTRCLSCGEPVEGEAVFSIPGGGVRHPRCGGEGGERLDANRLAALRYLSTRSFSAACNLKVRPPDARSLFSLLHPFTRHHLGFEPRSLRSLK